MTRTVMFTAAAAAAFTAAMSGCSKPPTDPTQTADPTQIESRGTDKVVAERAKLSPEDRAGVEAQEWCAYSTKSRLGSMGPPVKVDVGGETVFICCAHCEKGVKADPSKTHDTVAKLREKAKAGRDARPGS